MALQGFQIEADRGDGRFEFMGDGIEKTIVALVRFTSLTRNMVFSTSPAISSRKKGMPITSRMTLRQLMMIQPTLRVMARATRQAPRVMKKAIAFLCLVIRIACQPLPKYSGGKREGRDRSRAQVGNRLVRGG